jgi:GDP-L-fucose synthase
MAEEMLLTGLPEFTNVGYALAKLCGSRLCGYYNRQYGADFISAVPANAYVINDCFDPEKSHVIPALFLKFQKAKQSGVNFVKLWGTGSAMREFIYTDDMADACIFLMDHYSSSEPINIGSGSEISIFELSKMVKKIVGYEGTIICDPTLPDGMKRRMVDNRKISALGWQASISLEEGLWQVYEWMLTNDF